MSLTYLDSEWGYTHGEVAEHVPSVMDSDWGVAHATVATPGRPTLQRGGSEVAPAWSVIKAGVEVPVSWHAIKAGIEVPLATSMGPAWTPPTYVVGAGPVGSTHYPIPTEDVIYMAPGGSDAAAGTLAAPKATLAAALTACPDGGTVVIRAGTYHDGEVEAGARAGVTVQNYPGEAVWFDGTVPHGGWTATGGVWVAPYALTLDRMLGKTAAGLAVFSGAPTRVITDQVWVDGVRLQAVADGSIPGPGQFSVDQAADTLTIGTNPDGKEVRIADLKYVIAGSGLTVRGIGMRRYVQARLEWRGATLTLDESHVEELTVEHCSVNGISVGGAGATIRKCTVQDVGLMGMGSGDSSNGLIELNLVRRTNRGGFDPEPVAAGLKVFRVLEGLAIRFNHFEDVANGSAIWLDTSVNRSYIIGNTVNGDSALGTAGRCKTGIEIEGSDGGYYDGVQHYSYVVGNRVSNCRQGGFLVFDSGYIKAWNNSFSAAVAVWLWQDYRENTGAKPLEGTPEQTPWHTNNVQLVNNALIPEDAFKTQLRAQCNADAPYKIAGGAMLSRLSTNWLRPQGSGLMAYLSDAAGSGWNIRATLDALATTPVEYGGPLGPIMDGNHQGDTPPPAGAGTPIEADVAAAAGIPAGYQPGVGPIWPPLVLAQGSNG